LEEKLVAIDKEDSEKCLTATMAKHVTVGRTKKSSERIQTLMDEICEKPNACGNLLSTLRCDYLLTPANALVMRTKAFVALNAPHPDDQDSLGNEVGNQMPLVLGEKEFLERNDDFISLPDGHEVGWLDIAVCKLLEWIW